MSARVIGHRGAGGLAPDNTMEAFQMAVKMGLGGIETDLQVTKDDVVILFHDDSIGPNKTLIGELTYDQIIQLDSTVPTLEQALTFFKPHSTRLILELKGDKWGEQEKHHQLVRDLITKYQMSNNAVFSSFHSKALELVDISFVPSAFLFDAPKDNAPHPEDFYETLRQLKASEAHLRASALLVDPSCVDRLHLNGVKVMAWFSGKDIETDFELQSLVTLGVDFICTNRPDLLIPIISSSVSGSA